MVLTAVSLYVLKNKTDLVRWDHSVYNLTLEDALVGEGKLLYVL